LGISLQIFAIIFMARLVVDTAWRMVYPFIPQISAGLGLTVVGFSWLIFVRSLAGLSGPLFGVLADRYGRRIMMMAGVGILGLGLLVIPLTQQGWAIGPMFLFGLGGTALVPIQQAYISDLVAYEKRGRALASVDISYSVAGIVGLPLAGWLIDSLGWRAPFLLLGVLALSVAPLIWFNLPAVSDRRHQHRVPTGLGAVLSKAGVLASIGVGAFLFLALGCFATVWGIWFSEDFGLDAVALGSIATIISLAELSGVSLSSLLIDRLGTRFGGQLGILLIILTFVLLPWTQGQLVLAVTVLIFMGAALEFTVVSLFPLYSVQAPEAQATVFSLVGVGISLGLALSSPITAILWQRVGLVAVCAVAIGCSLIALVLLRRFLHEQPGSGHDMW
jgi:predicted MFS family arabinose efflux permease